jgi:hypothetical protein
MKVPVTDIFSTEDIEMPVDVVVPKAIAKKEISNVPYPEKRESAYTLVNKSSLSEDEYHTFKLALEVADAAIKSDTTETSFVESKIKLLDLLAKRFGLSSATEAKQQGLSFNLKQNFEVELLKSRDSG